METRSNFLLVSVVVALLLAWLVGYMLWASPGTGRYSRIYEIRFDRSVAGLAVRSPVTYSGVGVGRVERIRFDPVDPEIVRVRVVITDPGAPILEGTTASLERDFLGTALITLSGAQTGGRPIVPAREGQPGVIPARKGGGLLDDPVSLVENIARTTDRLNQMLTPEGQRSISQEIAALERRSAALAEKAPGLAATLAGTRSSIRQGTAMTDQMGDAAGAMNRKVLAARGRGDELQAQLRDTRAQLRQLDERLNAMRPTVQNLPGADMAGQLRDLRGTVGDFTETLQGIDRSGLGGLSEPPLPDYESRR
jgi:phospholipid/cholesterol/gamma-HCH transport system substrate-binding protein